MNLPYYKLTPEGVPVLSSEQINRITDQLVRELQPELYYSQIDAVSLSLVMKHLSGWHFAGRYLSKSGSLLGLACFQGGTMPITDETRTATDTLAVPPRSILVDRRLFQKEYERMFRFTLAHEIGHALLHEHFASSSANMQAYQEQGNQRRLEDTAERFGIREKKELNTAYDWIEWQANAFASSLLMPKTLIRQTRNLVFSERIPYMEFLNELCITVTDVFKVSHTAAFYRLKELDIAPEDSHILPNGVIAEKGL
ncbi:MAG: ImmA/IrrE family metallo-endopeptidase [Lachnospiraceae bacterium]|nr:ImmA/IrrE family metallo-endopeptidase [Lachnospiraceae bacterium]